MKVAAISARTVNPSFNNNNNYNNVQHVNFRAAESNPNQNVHHWGYILGGVVVGAAVGFLGRKYMCGPAKEVENIVIENPIDPKTLSVAIGCDHGGYQLKLKIIDYLKSLGVKVEDFGTKDEKSCNYPDFAKPVSEAVASGKFNRGILVCTSGEGMTMAANKVNGIRAALCFNLRTAHMTRLHNDSNVLCLGRDNTDEETAKKIVEMWLKTPFEGGRHQARVDGIAKIEEEQRKKS